MGPLIDFLLAGCVLCFGLLLLADAFSRGARRSLLWQAILLLALLVTLNLTTGFPKPSTAQSFGGFSPVFAVAIMFASVLAGIAARYVFYRRARYTWRSFLKPLVISPIVLLPLLGSLQGIPSLEPIQLVSFALLSFQNGFFWETVLERAHQKL